jgi:uncharacterized protein
MKLHIANNLALPASDAVTRTMVVYGGRGMGKTNFGTVLCEELARARLRFCYIDPMGHLWGLRHSADGKGPGIEVLILGGRHGDIPIDPTSGAVVADLVADEQVNVVVDISRRADGKSWSKGERIRFVTDYAKRLYERQGERMRPIMQIIDEAARFIPQIARHGDDQVAACIGAVEQMVEEGRGVGIGVTLITQRSARLSKSVAELAEAMIAFRTIGPNSVDAILDWFGEHILKDRWKSLVEKLRTLPRGYALVVSPGWLGFEGVAFIRQRNTFDSSATPKAGHERRARGSGAKPDLARYTERMKATIEHVLESDPKHLKRRIAELEAILAKANHKAERIEEKIDRVIEKRVEVPVVKDAQIKRLEVVADRALKHVELFQRISDGLRLDLSRSAIHFHRINPAAVPPPARPLPDIRAPVHAPAPTPTRAQETGSNGAMTPAVRRVLESAALLYPEPVSRKQLATLSGYRPKGGRFNNILSELRSRGLLAGRADDMRVTDEALNHIDPKVTGYKSPAEMRDMWRARLAPAEWRVLEAAMGGYPGTLTREELAARVLPRPYSPSAGRFNNLLSSLRSAALLEGTADALRVSPHLMEGT